MLTPAFNLSQNDNFLLLKIKAPYSKVSETEIHFEGTDFHFYSKPYFLRLVFPGLVRETGGETASYNVDEGSFMIQIPKENPGEWFEGLDLQTKLLAPKGKVSAGPMIQVLDSEDSEVNVSNEDDEEFHWEIYQNQYTEEEEDNDADHFFPRAIKYGFASLKTDAKLFSRLQEEMPDLLDVRIQNYSSVVQRRRDRLKREAEDFSDDHYLADLYETDEITRLLSHKPWWTELEEKTSGDDSLTSEKMIVFSEKENMKMRSLPNKEYLLDQATKQEVLLNLVDILFAYGYNARTTEGENTVESAWTICKLSSTLSWLETFTSLESVLVSSVRRSLSYPLYRHWDLAMSVLDDTVKILSLGPKFVLKCLLEIHDLFNESEPRYILNDLYITDYCVWIQTVKCKVLSDLAEALKKVSIHKSCLDLDLVELELAADLVLKTEGGDAEEKSVEDISNKLCELKIQSPTSEMAVEASGTSDDEESSSSSSSSSDQLSQCELESSDSDTSDESSSSLDSDDYSSSDNYDSSEDDDDDTDTNEGNAENCLLLGNFHSIEKIR